MQNIARPAKGCEGPEKFWEGNPERLDAIEFENSCLKRAMY